MGFAEHVARAGHEPHLTAGPALAPGRPRHWRATPLSPSAVAAFSTEPATLWLMIVPPRGSATSLADDIACGTVGKGAESV
jgi:hypothetical protein